MSYDKEKKDKVLKVRWSKKENDFLIFYPRRCDGALLQHKLFTQNMLFDYVKWDNGSSRTAPYKMEDDFIKELENRGYDKTTLKFEITLKPQTNE
jgi:hypothetical protein